MDRDRLVVLETALTDVERARTSDERIALLATALDQAGLETLAQDVTSSVEKSRRYEESERERARGEALAEIARAVNSSLRIADVLDLSLRHTIELLNTRGAGIGLLHDEDIIVVAAIGSAEQLIGAPVPLHSSITGRAILERRTIIVNDANVDDAYGPTRIATNADRTIVAPLFSSDGVIGALSVLDADRDFTADDARVLQRLADQIAVAIGNARLYEEERSRAVALQRSERRYLRLVQSASDAIFTADLDGCMTSVNRSMERATGMSRAELVGALFVKLVEPSDHAAANQALEAAIHGRRSRVNLRYVNALNERRLCSLTLTPLAEPEVEVEGEPERWSGEVVVGVLGVARDVTDERRLAEQLMQQEKLAAVGQLVSGVAHELNNPLASVIAFAQLLLASPAGAPTDRPAIDAIHQEAKRAAKIVSNLLTFARQRQPERRVTDLNKVVDDTLELRRYALRNAQTELVSHLDPELPLTWADPFQLQQVVLNLVTNAEQALMSWSGPKSIDVTTAMVNDHLVIRISDTGAGVAPEHIHRIFNPFFTTKPVGEGTGLGLSISDGIVREHGGRIRVESIPGEGATFTIELPHVAPPDEVDEHSGIELARRTPKRRILVVDDESTLRHVVARFFRSLGHDVDAVGTGRDAVARAAGQQYDAMVLDLRLPDITGDEVLSELNQASGAPKRIVLVTGDMHSESVRQLLDARDYPILSKPFVLDELASVVLAEPR